MITHTIDSYWIPSQTRQSQRWEFKEIAKISNFGIFRKTQHATHIQKLVSCVNIVEDTEQTQFCPQTDRQMDKVKPVYPPSTLLSGAGVGAGVGVGGYDYTTASNHATISSMTEYWTTMGSLIMVLNFTPLYHIFFQILKFLLHNPHTMNLH